MPLKKARLKISEYSATRKASVSKTERKIRMVSLSLTSMVDMFAILVIFLLSSQDSATPMLDFGHGVQLPKAKTAAPPPQGVTLEVAKSGVYFQSKKLVDLDNLHSADAKTLAPLRTWLETQLKAELANPNSNKRLNLVADERLPYGTVRRIVAMAKRSGYAELSLAVEPKK